MTDEREPFLIPELETLREQFRVVAAAEQAAIDERATATRPQQRPWWRRSRGRTLGVIVAVLGAGGAAAATATQLISTGKPVPDAVQRQPRYEPGHQQPLLVLTAGDRGTHATWGVAVYDSPAGQNCVLAGVVRGTRLGLLQGDLFRPYARDTGGACRELRPRTFVSVRQVLTVEGQDRTLVFGRAGTAVHAMRVATRDGVKHVPVRQAGSFLFVFAGRVTGRDYDIDALDRRNKVIRP